MKDLTVTLEDRPGTLADLGEALGKAGINIEGLCAVGSEGRAIVHLLVDDAAATRGALEGAGIKVEGEADPIDLRARLGSGRPPGRHRPDGSRDGRRRREHPGRLPGDEEPRRRGHERQREGASGARDVRRLVRGGRGRLGAPGRVRPVEDLDRVQDHKSKTCLLPEPRRDLHRAAGVRGGDHLAPVEATASAFRAPQLRRPPPAVSTL